MINYFKSWIYLLIGISIISLLIELILPKIKIKKYIYMVVGILTSLILISPVVNILEEKNIEQTVSQVVNKLEEESGYTKEEVEEMLSKKNKIVLKSVVSKIKEDIKLKAKTYGMNAENVSVSIDDKYEISEIVIESTDKLEIERIKAIIKYVAEMYKLEESKIIIKCEVK